MLKEYRMTNLYEKGMSKKQLSTLVFTVINNANVLRTLCEMQR